MGLPWKYLLPLVVVLPLGAFVAGSLASTADDEPPARTPIVLRQDSDSPIPDGRATDAPPDPTTDPDQAPPDDDDDREDDDDVHVVSPTPVDGDDDDDDDSDGAGENDDDGGDDRDD